MRRSRSTCRMSRPSFQSRSIGLFALAYLFGQRRARGSFVRQVRATPAAQQSQSRRSAGSGGEQRPCLILRRDFRNGARPPDCQLGVVETKTAFRLWSVEGTHEIENRRRVGKGLIAVGEALWHIDREPVVLRKFGAEPAKIC